jgi:GT2 family glycosyltransferase
MHSQKIAIITVNYKTPALVVDCIRSVAAERSHLPNITMFVVDNDSRDGSLDQISAFVSDNRYDWVTVIAAGRNGGYAAGNNVVLRRLLANEIDADFVWLLNPDTRLEEGAGARLVEFALRQNVGLVGSRLEFEDGTLQDSSFNFPGVVSELCNGARLGVLDRLLKSKLVRREVRKEPEPCDWLAGASLMISMDVVRAVGPMDERYFLYFEETDYCLQARRAGFRCWYVPESRVFHVAGAATGISDDRKRKPRIPPYWFDSRRRYFLHNHGAWTLAVADALFIVGYCTWVVRKSLFGRSVLKNEPPHFLMDFIRHSFLVRGFGV